ncbi:hypothetical protein [Bdellovibrio sp. HCB274]|uniref:hypothetical protein n=1 Tax=Bdellovibrio sp. HCB274 TaxID=3394361 RepID=UPI0039B59B4E
MGTTVRTTTIIFLTFFTIAVSAADILLNPIGTSINQRILSYQSYDDIRIDSDLDGKVDEWYIKSGNTEAHLSYKNGQIKSMHFKRFIKENVLVRDFESISGRMILTHSEERPLIVMYGDAEEGSCEPTQILKDKVSTLNQDISAVLEKVGSKPKSCDMNEFPNTSKRISIALKTAQAEPGTITRCLEGKDLGNIDANLASAKIVNFLSKISSNPTTDGSFTCAVTDTSRVSGKTTEDGKIKLEVPKDFKDGLSMFRAQELIAHELLHSGGIVEEEMLTDILRSCFNSKSMVQNFVTPARSHVEDSMNKNSKVVASTKKETARAALTSTQEPAKGKRSLASTPDDSVNMKNEIANAKAIVPSGEKLNVAKVDKSPAGKEKALRDSVQESAPVLKMANQVMGVSNTPAMADSSNESNDSNYSPPPSRSSRSSSSYSSSGGGDAYSGTSTYSDSEVSGSGSGSGSSSSGRRYQSRHGRYQSKSSSDGGVGSDEFIAEEVDLTKGTNSRSSASTRRAPASNQNDTRPYVSAAQENSTNSREPASATDEISKGRRSRPVASGGSDGFVPSSSGGGGSSINLGSSSGGSGGSGSGGGSSAGSASGTRNTAKAATQTRSPASVVKGSPAQKQMMSTIVDSNYDETIRKIRNDKQFQDELINNSIKVIDNYGGAWGAPDGSVIYQATGNGFVRQR